MGKITYQRWAKIPRPVGELVQEIKERAIEAEMAVLKAEMAVNKALRKLDAALDARRDSYTEPVSEYTMRYVDCSADEADYMIEDYIPVAVKVNGEWKSCAGPKLGPDIWDKLKKDIASATAATKSTPSTSTSDSATPAPDAK